MMEPLARALATGSFVLSALLLLSISDAGAQERTLVIRDGRVILDGRMIPPADLPGQLDLQGLQAEFRFRGNEPAVIGVGDNLLVIENNRLVPFDASRHSPANRFFTQHRRMADQYIMAVMERDRALSSQLTRELQMEAESLRLAAQLRTLKERSARAGKEAELRSRLQDIFELKQQNRREEISQLEDRLQDLKRRLLEREQMKSRIIDLRLDELIGRTGGQAEW